MLRTRTSLSLTLVTPHPTAPDPSRGGVTRSRLHVALNLDFDLDWLWLRAGKLLDRLGQRRLGGSSDAHGDGDRLVIGRISRSNTLRFAQAVRAAHDPVRGRAAKPVSATHCRTARNTR